MWPSTCNTWKGSKAATEEVVNGLAWAHSVAGMPSPTTDPLVQAVLDGCKRVLAKPTAKKAPFTAEMLKSITENALAVNSLASIRLATMCLIGFAGFLCYSELASIRLSDIELHPGHLKIRIIKSRKEQLRQGDRRSSLERNLYNVQWPCWKFTCMHGEGRNYVWVPISWNLQWKTANTKADRQPLLH